MIRYQYSNDSVKYEDIHPEEVSQQEHQLAKTFVESFPASSSGPSSNEPLFSLWGYDYTLNPASWDLSINPLPAPKALEDFFHNSDLAHFRASESFQTHASETRAPLWNDLLEWTEGRIFRHLGEGAYKLIDFGSRYIGWVNKLQESKLADTLTLAEALPPLSSSSSTELPQESADIITAFDVIQRKPDPTEFLLELYKKLKPGGLLLLSTRSGSGFDILALQENIGNVFPFEHLYLPSPWGMEALAKKTGFEIVKVEYRGDSGNFIP